MKQIDGFFRHNEHERGVPAPIQRSSALFYVIETGDTHTDLLLFNYWLHKRRIDDLELQVTLRDAAGNHVSQTRSGIDFRGARTLRARELLDRCGRPGPFEGSIEIEILSPTNLFIPYPAIVVRYHGAGWHTTTHSYSRIFAQTSADSPERIEGVQKTVEGNWTVPGETDRETFFVVHNGPRTVPAHQMSITLVNAAGERREVSVPVVGYAPHETRRYNLARLVDYHAFLAGQPGTAEVSTLVAGVFPRMLCGTKRRNSSAFTADHSNFNYTGEGGRLDVCAVRDKPSATKKSLGFMIPTPVGDGWRCYADFYPTYPDGDYRITLGRHALDGSRQDGGEVLLADSRDAGPKKLMRLEVSHLLAGIGAEGALDLTIDHEVAVPTRLHMGIHYQLADGLPAFIIDGPMPYTFNGKSTRWFPVIHSDECTTHVMIANQVFDSANTASVGHKALLYNSFDEAPLEAQFTLGPGASRICQLDEIFAGAKEYLRGAEGWVYLKTDKPAFSVMHYVIKYGADSLAADHAF
jgi:hypothetical protein